MGMIRKTASVCTLGLIDYWSDKERAARNTNQAAAQAKKQTKIMKKQAKQQRKQAR